MTADQKQAALVEFTKVKTELACGVKHPKNWLKMLCSKHNGINPRTLRDLASGKTKVVDGRKDNKGQPTVIDKNAEDKLLLHMANCNYNQTYKEIEKATGIPAMTVWRYFKAKKWRSSGTRNFRKEPTEKSGVLHQTFSK
jgi:hypothetical protein